MMVESEAKELTEEVMLGAVMFAHDECKQGHQPDHQAGRKGCQGSLGRCRFADNSAIKDQAQEADRQGYRRRLQADRQVGALERAERSPCQGQGAFASEDPQTQMVAMKR
jgi:polyribonucleotide nucleotidyltransferase